MRKYLLSKEGNFYKANLHAHTNLSDGNLSPEEMKEHYQANGYSVLAYTDHDIFIPHHELTDEMFVALSAFEAEVNEQNLYPGKRELKACHLCFIAKSPDINMHPFWHEKYAYIGNSKKYWDKVRIDRNAKPYERDYSAAGINDMIRKGREAGFFVTYNHPTWSLENYNDYTKYEGLHAMEIFNYACEVLGYPSYLPNVYDDMLRTGRKIFAVAADDNHNKHPEDSPKWDSCGGFVMIKAKELKYETITEALFAGDFYASEGPEIYDLYIEGNEIHISCSDSVLITLNTGRRSSQTAIAPKGSSLREATFTFHEDDVYLRISVKDANGRFADTRAYFLEDM